MSEWVHKKTSGIRFWTELPKVSPASRGRRYRAVFLAGRPDDSAATWVLPFGSNESIRYSCWADAGRHSACVDRLAVAPQGFTTPQESKHNANARRAASGQSVLRRADDGVE